MTKKTIEIQIPEGYDDAVFDKETNEIKFIKGSKLGNKVTIDGVEGYVLEVDDAGEPTVLCSEILGEMSWENAMKTANQDPWYLPTVEEWKKYWKAVKELDGDWSYYWTSTEYSLLGACYVDTGDGDVSDDAKRYSYCVRAFAFVGSKKDRKPRSWEEYRQQVCNTPCYAIDILSKDGRIIVRNRELCPQVNEVNTEEEAKAVVALCKLIQLRDAWWGDWRPDWNNDSNIPKYGICNGYNNINTDQWYNYNRILVFPTAEMRDEFLETFRYLIEEAKPLL